MGLIERLFGGGRGGPVRVVPPPGSPPSLRREVEEACLEYARALGVRLPALVVELVDGGYGQRRRPSWERLTGGAGPVYRVVLWLREGKVAAGELREALLELLADAGALAREARPARAGADGHARAEGAEGAEEAPAAAAGDGGSAAAPRQRVPSRVRERWRARGAMTSLEPPPVAGAEGLPELAEALSRRRLELVSAAPYPAAGAAAQLDSVADLVLAEPAAAIACLRALARGIAEGSAFVPVMAPDGAGEGGLWRAGQTLAGVRLAAGAMRAGGRVYLRLPMGIDRLVSYLQGEWLERAAARAVTRALGRRGLWAGHAATRARVRLPSGDEAEMDVVALARGGGLVWAECAVRPQNLMADAARRRLLQGACLLPGDLALVVCALLEAGERERVRQAYGWPVWSPGDGLGALEELVAAVDGADGRQERRAVTAGGAAGP